ncbi:MAG: hypothetical protein PVJ67_03400 [Candidatus Pacearchaeota archaeon]|jgi:hypothetical protein
MKVKTFIQLGTGEEALKTLDGMVNALNAKKIFSVKDKIERRSIVRESYSDKYQGMLGEVIDVPHTIRIITYED